MFTTPTNGFTGFLTIFGSIQRKCTTCQTCRLVSSCAIFFCRVVTQQHILSYKPPFFALVIGIDKYKYAGHGIGNLNGCVADANDIAEFLTKTLGVPAENIVNLRNQQATRAGIKSHIQRLASDDRICPKNPVLIYYAGHGAQAKAPLSWAAGRNDNLIQMLVPHDFNPKTNGEQNAQGIPDITLAGLLTQLSKAKGDNIVWPFQSFYAFISLMTSSF